MSEKKLVGDYAYTLLPGSKVVIAGVVWTADGHGLLNIPREGGDIEDRWATITMTNEPWSLMVVDEVRPPKAKKRRVYEEVPLIDLKPGDLYSCDNGISVTAVRRDAAVPMQLITNVFRLVEEDCE